MCPHDCRFRTQATLSQGRGARSSAGNGGTAWSCAFVGGTSPARVATGGARGSWTRFGCGLATGTARRPSTRRTRGLNLAGAGAYDWSTASACGRRFGAGRSVGLGGRDGPRTRRGGYTATRAPTRTTPRSSAFAASSSSRGLLLIPMLLRRSRGAGRKAVAFGAACGARGVGGARWNVR